jgi:hypothetical protein
MASHNKDSVKVSLNFIHWFRRSCGCKVGTDGRTDGHHDHYAPLLFKAVVYYLRAMDGSKDIYLPI